MPIAACAALATPEQRARMLSAVRSATSSLRVGPETLATGVFAAASSAVM